MTSDTAPLDYILNIVRREFGDEFPDMTVIFISHHTGRREEALQKRQDEIFGHPAGRALWPQLKLFTLENDNSSALAGFSRMERNRYFNLLKKEIFLAVFFVNADEVPSDDEDAALLNKNLAYSLGWQAFSMRTSWKKKRLLKPEGEDGSAEAPAPSRTEWLRRRMTADCFAAMLLETKGEKGAISRLLKRRCELSMLPAIRYRPEHFPFPVALDATHLVYKDLKDTAPPGTGPIAHSFFMAQEISQTYDDISLRQWVSFCRAAQEMAWAGHSKSEILGAAVYTNDDAYIRSTAYIVAETLNTDPIPLKHTDFYNPFAEDETNERLHFKRCRGGFEEIAGKLKTGAEAPLLLKEAQRQNAALIGGDPAGWCAPALLAAHSALETALSGGEDQPFERMTGVFRDTLAQTGWAPVRKLHRLIIAAKRRGEIVTPDKAGTLASQEPDTALFKPAFDIQPPKG